ncbi:putative signal transducing protein [Caldithrix abyssi]|uniref:Signal transducing protein n=1 Tax=Caldithrix abyssi DSM 13497 TaxID=880073 RepID=H1XYA4_CALAY|nr:DUF2007 domain-containing protein [Caldithrix abyssi]APF19264.1 Putative signal transducing protein [Caldithrix abyssi DSM 13497]EHO43171.1 hypothetical protein Calab_3573 [Caldithrix abyssi DSM 13497]
MERLKFLKNFPNRPFAEQAREILESNNIGCVLKSPDVGILGGASSSTLNGVDLYVDQDDFEKARTLIDALYDGI